MVGLQETYGVGGKCRLQHWRQQHGIANQETHDRRFLTCVPDERGRGASLKCIALLIIKYEAVISVSAGAKLAA